MEIDREAVVRTQEVLSGLPGCPGHEEEVAAFLLEEIRPSVDRAWIDAVGNVLAVREGRAGGTRILLDAHMDEVGFIVSHVEPGGFLRVDALGGIDPRVLPGALVQLVADGGGRVIGVMGSVPPHVSTPQEREKVPEIRELFVDVGADSDAAVAGLGLHVGSVGTFHTPFLRLDGDTLAGRAFDDRTACNVLLQTARLLAAPGSAFPAATVCYSFSVQEEFSQLGAQVAAAALRPTLALAIENTLAVDTPGTPPQKVVTRLGGGPAVTVADRTAVVPRALQERIRRAAEAAGVPWQYKKPVYGGTNAGRISLAGLPCGVVSVPCRYIHGPVGLLRVADLLDTIRLVTEFCRSRVSQRPSVVQIVENDGVVLQKLDPA